MKLATCCLGTLDPLKENAHPVTLTKAKVLNPRLTLIYVPVQEFLPDKLQSIGNTLSFWQTKISLVLSTTYTVTEAYRKGFYLPLALNK